MTISNAFVRCFGLQLALFATPAVAQTGPALITYGDSTANPEQQRVLHYRIDAPETEAAPKVPERAVGDAPAARAAEAGLLAPTTLSPEIHRGQSWTRAVGGYDTAAQASRARVAAESAVTSTLALRVEFEHGPSLGTSDRVALGGRIQVLTQNKHGFDGGLGLFYQPNDFRREGNVLGGLLLGRHFGRLGTFASVLFGSDPEGDDQEVDARLGAMVRVTPLVTVGWDNRFRGALTSDAKRIGTSTIDWDLTALPTVLLTLGHVAIAGELGLSARQQTGPIGQPEQQRSVRAGMIAMAGAAAAF